MIKRYLTVLLIAGGGVLLALGLYFGQNSQVLAKAMQICLECIGIG